MKKLLIPALIIMSSYSITQAQNRQVSLGVLGDTGFMVYKFGKNEKNKTRLSVAGRHNSSDINTNTYVPRTPQYAPGVEYTRKSSNTDLSIALGRQFGSSINDKLSIYYGIDLSVIVDLNSRKTNWSMKDSVAHSAALDNYSIIEFEDYSFYRNGDYYKDHESHTAFGLGIRPMLGFTYQLTDNISIGVERQISLLTSKYYFGQKSTYQSSIHDVITDESFQNNASLITNFWLSGRNALTVNYMF